MPKREAISNKLRFEVFKRDSFKCQYCGKSAPEVILNVDHITPVSKGGKSDILNLVTSCFPCNSGKSDRKLDDNSVVSIQKQQLDELNERRVQLDMLVKWKSLLTEENNYTIYKIVEYFIEKNKSPTFELTPVGEKNLKALIKKYGISKIIDAIDQSHEKFYGTVGVCDLWGKLPKFLNFMCSSESDQNKMKFFGGVRARFEGTCGYNKWNVINGNNIIRELFQVIDDKTTTLDYTFLFKVLNRNADYEDFLEDIRKVQNVVTKLLDERQVEAQ